MLITWLQKLQDEFVNRMASIDADAAEALDDDDDDGSEGESEIGTEVNAGTRAKIQEQDRSMSHDGGHRSEESGESVQSSPEQRFVMTGAVLSETGD